jgi:hypothetical protein
LSDRWPESLNRRDVVSGLTLVGAAGFLGIGSELAAAEPPPETTRRLRLLKAPSLSLAHQYDRGATSRRGPQRNLANRRGRCW